MTCPPRPPLERAGAPARPLGRHRGGGPHRGDRTATSSASLNPALSDDGRRRAPADPAGYRLRLPETGAARFATRLGSGSDEPAIDARHGARARHEDGPQDAHAARRRDPPGARGADALAHREAASGERRDACSSANRHRQRDARSGRARSCASPRGRRRERDLARAVRPGSRRVSAAFSFWYDRLPDAHPSGLPAPRGPARAWSSAATRRQRPRSPRCAQAGAEVTVIAPTLGAGAERR